MDLYPIGMKLCLGDIAIPVSEKTMDLVDLHNLRDGDHDGQVYSCVSLKATAEMWWFLKALVGQGLKTITTRWWIHQQHAIPLLMELRQAIKQGKTTSGSDRHLSRLPNAVVPVRIRDSVILVVNHSLNLTLALESGKEVEVLQWFLKHLTLDIKKMLAAPAAGEEPAEPQGDAEEPASSSSRPSKRRQALEDPEEEQILLQSLAVVQGHEQCSSAVFLPSRLTFKIIRMDKKTLQVTLKNLAKRRSTRQENMEDSVAMDAVRAVYDQGVREALSFLESL